MSKKITKCQSEAFQKARNRMSRDRKLWGKVFTLYGYGDNKNILVLNANTNYKDVHVVNTPKIIRTVDPYTAKYVAYVHGRRKK